MAKCVFTTRVSPSYDDLPEVRYQFPKRYLRFAEAAVGDWIVYYEPRNPGEDAGVRRGRMAYFATAKVTKVEPDQKRRDHYYAFVEQYLEFPNPVPLRVGSLFMEGALRSEHGLPKRGLMGWAMRPIPDAEYDLIVRAGLARDPRVLDLEASVAVAEDRPEPAETILTRRTLRDAAFSGLVSRAYNSTCAFTGLRLINGGGNREVEAAHIKPVSERGPDSVRNGLAISRTAHWLFDHGLLSLENDGRILTVPKLIPPAFSPLLRREGYVVFPKRDSDRPHRLFLDYHRDNIYRG